MLPNCYLSGESERKMDKTLPRLHVGSEALSDFDKAIQKEWLITNGLGGFASSTVLGVNTRKYHALLIAAFNPPVDRRVLLTRLDEEIGIGNQVYSTEANEFKWGVKPQGYQHLTDFWLSPFPVYKYDLNGVQLQKTLFMPYRKNAMVVSYEVSNPHESEVSVRVKPTVNSRHFHSVTNKEYLDWGFVQKPFDHGVLIQPSVPLSALGLYSTGGQYFSGEGEWVRETYFRVDASRGDSCLDDGYKPGFFAVKIGPMETKRFYVVTAAGKTESEAQSLLASVYGGKTSDVESLYALELKRLEGLLDGFQRRHADVNVEDWLKWLLFAADSFIVDRKSTDAKSVIAGYHWFSDWGRDSLISLPGLTLVTGKFEDARSILLTFKQYCKQGLIPNMFPDFAGENPVYNTVDGTLWYVNAVLQYAKYTGDFEFIQKELWTTLKSIIENHVNGTLFGIRMENDGLVAHGSRLTWMDVMVGDRIITPREGKAVEIQALWYNALKTMEMLAKRFAQQEEAERYAVMAEKARKSFVEKFWNPQNGYLFDVVSGQQGDASMRPNQVIAVSLDFSMVDKAIGEKVVETVWKRLWGVCGLKTLAADDPRYVKVYLGERVHRDTAYHNGTIWAWPVGPFVTAFLKVKRYEEHWRNFAFENFLKPLFQEKIFEAGLGTLSEIFEPEPPHQSRECISQAWSVAEPLRAYVEDVLLQRPPYEMQIQSS